MDTDVTLHNYAMLGEGYCHAKFGSLDKKKKVILSYWLG